MKPKLLFLTLNIFSATGGIEKVARVAGKALHELTGEGNMELVIYSAYDRTTELDPRYFPADCFRGFGGRRVDFVCQSLSKGPGAAMVLLSHCNLLPVGYAIKMMQPKTKLVLLAHGIEVWDRWPAWKRRLLKACDLVLPVSQYTRNRMIAAHGLDAAKLQVINNCLDPFLPPAQEGKSLALLKRYGFTPQNKVLFTLTRLSAKEQYKGYDEVIMAVKSLKEVYPGIRYLVAGRYDREEKERIDRLVRQQRLEDTVVLAGFVPDAELAAHFALADLFVMPSRKEGFGIVFIEALHYGKPVIAGNKDGSVDALANGDLGWLVRPNSRSEIRVAIETILEAEKAAVQPNPEEVRRRFGFPVYQRRMRDVLEQRLPGWRALEEEKKQTSANAGCPAENETPHHASA